MPYKCPHHDEKIAGKVCGHLLTDPDNQARCEYFTGNEVESYQLCWKCGAEWPEKQTQLYSVCDACLKKVQQEVSIEGILGTPSIRERTTSLRLYHEMRNIPELNDTRIVGLAPFSSPRGDWIVLTDTGQMARLDPLESKFEKSFKIDATFLDMSKPVSLHISKDSQFIAVANSRGQFGRVIDLRTGVETMRLDRGNYYIAHYLFSIAFIEHLGKALVVHATDWNRLDISDPATGVLLTTRNLPSYAKGEPSPQHYLDYFHGRLHVSPNENHIYEDGWVWSPVGVPCVWNLRNWLTVNPWESEDGPSRHRVGHRSYFWDGPACWIDDTTLAIYGYGTDDDWIIPAAIILDATTGKRLRWFPGPEGEFVFDKHLLCFSDKSGMSVWDVATGERLFKASDFKPTAYHPSAHHFLTIRADGIVLVSGLT